VPVKVSVVSGTDGVGVVGVSGVSLPQATDVTAMAMATSTR
jgi:hypothetical protein